jgi:hypothetical protein
MASSNPTVLQVVPQLPGSHDGVGDYALNLAKALSARYGLRTMFVVAQETEVASIEEFPIVSGLGRLARLGRKYDHLILHYANYGYQARGVPFQLRDFARQLRRQLRGRWVTMFHELYAFGPPWKSAFWLRPLQVRIARDIIDVSDSCFVSSHVIENEIHAYDSHKPVHLRPVMSNFGEPRLVNFGERSLTHWVICGGTTLISRSLRSFTAAQQMIPKVYFPERLEIIGGRQDSAIRDLIQALSRVRPGISCRHYPEVTVERASEILSDCSFAWIDYFGKGKAWPGMIFKSGSFAACCAHGVVPVLSHEETGLAVDGDAFPAEYFVSRRAAQFAKQEQISDTRTKIYTWYHRHASAERTAQAYAEVLA